MELNDKTDGINILRQTKGGDFFLPGFGGGIHFRPRRVPGTWGTASGMSGVDRA
jgi:hypothetical protein